MALKCSKTVANCQSFQRWLAILHSQRVCWISEAASSSWKPLQKFGKRNVSEVCTCLLYPYSLTFKNSRYAEKLYFQNCLVRSFSAKSYNSVLPEYYNKWANKIPQSSWDLILDLSHWIDIFQRLQSQKETLHHLNFLCRPAKGLHSFHSLLKLVRCIFTKT